MTQPNTPNLNDLAKRLETVRAAMQRIIDKANGRIRKMRIITFVLAIFLAGYLGFFYNRLKKVDAEMTMLVAQSTVLDYLPSAKDQLKAKLKADAPAMVAAAGKQVLEVPEQVKNMLKGEVIKAFDTQLDAKQPEVEALIREQLKSIRETIQQTKPNATEKEKLDELVDVVAKVYRKEMQGRIQEVHNFYQKGSKDILAYANYLSTTRDLNAMDKAYRDMFQTFFVLIEKIQAEGTGN